MNDPILPNNIEVEENILGGILLDPSAMGRVIDLLTPEVFYITAHSTIYRAALDLYHQDKPTDLLSIKTWLSNHKLLKQVGGEAKLIQLLERTVSAVNIDHLASLVVDKYKRRELIAAGHDLVKLGHDTTTELESVFDQSEQKIFNLTTNKQDQFKPKIIGDCLAAVVTKISQGSEPAYPTGLGNLDTLIGGLIKQDLIIVAARASMGKTWLACHLTNHIATTQHKPVVFFSAEMSSEQLTKRLLSMHSGIDSHRLIHNTIYADEYETLKQALGTLGELPIIIDDTPASALTPAKIRSVLRKIRHERGELGLVVLDYIQKLGDRSAGNRAQAVGKFSGAFKDIAKEFDVPFVALAQINRGVESQSNKRPGMADIKDSGDIEQDMECDSFALN
ncbi:replicative DNA helicase [Chamaesiphon minutus]|uniref:Replicative DNA helicase n=1 Tax=Chamaesiphon minutus (strain ATCC 27169 / PCC 6605) TaxID=1173020 RepID=K9UED1_CHAP6|nr:replicative DNA helicase [Chamaesiphon minutus]AFY92877.1 replicative DNA helicase [Chamaesiphon minutus PCC 6605]AFY93190.1 replicative DNA helicase [Chamaesiphon minutus PCC 6605]